MTQPGKDGVAQWGGAALPDLIEAMAGRSRQLWLRLVIGVLIACIIVSILLGIMSINNLAN